MGMPMEQGQQIARHVGDVGAAGSMVAAVMGYWPAIAAGMTILWTAMRIVEMFTGRPFHESRIARAVVGLVRKVFPSGGDKP